MNLQTKLNKIQQELKAPKNQVNNFAHFNYRSCEDILEAVKPLLDGCTLYLSDEVVNVGNANYVKATATLHFEDDRLWVTAYAREAIDKKGMDDAQITGSASSYARKYALNGLFAIDDTKDADTQDNRKKAGDPIEVIVKKIEDNFGDAEVTQSLSLCTCHTTSKYHARTCPRFVQK